MTQLRVLQVHAFAAAVHGGSPAGVCLHDGTLDEIGFRRIAIDLGPSVTAFVGPCEQTRRSLRWFTREGAEVQSYCGHATFAAAHALLLENEAWIDFETISGVRRAVRKERDIVLEIPAWGAVEEQCPVAVIAAIGSAPVSYLRGVRDRLLVYPDAAAVRAISPDFVRLRQLGNFGFICTAPGKKAEEIVFRFFCPGFDIGEDEDPATGSAHSTLSPYWLDLLGRERIVTQQLSTRGAIFTVERDKSHLMISAPCTTFLDGIIHLQPEIRT